MVQKSRQKVSKDQESGKVWKGSLNPHPGQHPWDRGPSKEPTRSAPGHGPPSLQLTSRSAVKHVLNKPPQHRDHRGHISERSRRH